MKTKQRRKRKLLFITSFTLPDTAGSGINAFRFARFVNRQGDKATILTFNRNLRLKTSEIIDGVPIIRIPYFNKGILLKLLSLPMIILWYIIHILRNNIVIIYGGKTIGFEIVIILAKILGRKIIFQSLLTGIDDPYTLLKRNGLIAYIYKQLLLNLDCYFSINQNFSRQYVKALNNQKNLLETPQGVDVSIFTPSNNKQQLRKSLNLPFNKYLILSIGFLIHRKGLDEMFKMISTLNFNYHLILIGEYNIDKNHFLAEYRFEMKKLFQQGKSILGDKISFLGFKKNIEQYLNAADVFILNSEQEGLPNVLLEAMACEIPIIAKKIAGVDGFLTKNMKNSFVFHSLDEMINQLNYLHSNSEEGEKIAHQGKVDIINNYSFEHTYSRLMEKLYT